MVALTRLRLALDHISRTLTLIGAYGLLAATVMVVIEVVQRRTGLSSIEGADELSGYALAISTAWSFSYAFFRGSHIRIDALYRFLPVAWRARLDILATLALFALAVLFTYWAGIEFGNSLAYGAVSNTMLRTPTWIPQALWLSGLVLFAIATGVTLIDAGLRLATGDFPAVHRMIGDPGIAEMSEAPP